MKPSQLPEDLLLGAVHASSAGGWDHRKDHGNCLGKKFVEHFHYRLRPSSYEQGKEESKCYGKDVTKNGDKYGETGEEYENSPGETSCGFQGIGHTQIWAGGAIGLIPDRLL